MLIFKMLSSKMFNKNQPKTATQKKVDQLENLPLEELLKVINNSTDESLRQSAVLKINRLSDLLQLADLNSGKTQVNTLQKSAKKRIAQLLDANSISAQEFCQSVDDPLQRFAILGLMENHQVADEQLASIQNEEILRHIVIEATSSRIRQSAAHRISWPDILFALLKETKSSDKNVYKIVKDKCDQLKSAEKTTTDFVQAVNHLVANIEQHAHKALDPHYEGRLIYFTQQWSQLQQDAAALDDNKGGETLLSDELIARAQQALADCQAKISVHDQEQAVVVEVVAAPLDNSVQQQALIGRLEQTIIDSIQETPLSLANIFESWNQDWEIACKESAVSKTLQAQVKHWRDLVGRELEFQSKSGVLAEHSNQLTQALGQNSEAAENIYHSLQARLKNLELVKASEAYESAQKACDEFSNRKKAKADEAQQKLRQLGGLVRKIRETVDRGELRKAVGMRQSLKDKESASGHLPHHLRAQIEDLDAAIAKLNDWKSYAVSPKKLELIQQMQALVDFSGHAETRAEKIKRLQNEWKSLSKGTGQSAEEQALWDEFHELAQQAYEPCQIYFAEQSAIRSANLDKCKLLVEQLTAYVAQLKNSGLAGFDWRDADKVLRVARQEWRSYSPTERVATQPVLKAFEALLENIHQQVIAAQDEIAAKKQALIEKAQQALKEDDIRKAVDAIKAIQIEWQALSVCGHKQEQHLWHSFRDVCDQVFAKRQQQTAEFKTELETNHSSAKQWLAELNQLLALSGKDLFDAKSKVEEIRKSFSGLGQLPKSVAQEMRNQFQHIFHSYEEKVKAERQKEKQQIWVNLFAVNDAIRKSQLNLQTAPDSSAEFKTQLEQLLAETHVLPQGAAKNLQKKIDDLSVESSVEENADLLRQLCIKAEIAANETSPQSDVALRQQIQVEQLKQHFGKGVLNSKTDLEALAYEWVAIGVVDNATYQSCFERFIRCFNKVQAFKH